MLLLLLEKVTPVIFPEFFVELSDKISFPVDSDSVPSMSTINSYCLFYDQWYFISLELPAEQIYWPCLDIDR